MATLYNDDDLNKIILQCDYEDKYDNPIKMVDSNGKNIYAYVTLVMLGDRYIPAAIVLAQSLKNCGTKADLVVLVTPDVSNEGKDILNKFFDVLKVVEYVTVSNWRTKKQYHRKYLELVFTKFHLFNLVQYKKVILIDADAIVLKYPDHLFTLNTPAGCFLEDKDLFITYDNNGNYILPSNGKIEWYQKYCDCCGHGKRIPKEMTDRVKTNFKNSGIGGGLILLEPKVGEFDDIIYDISRGQMKYLLENKFVWPEQQYLTLRYSGNWTSINPRFFGLQGYPHWKIVFGLQYGGDKPFMLDSKIPINIRIEYPDFILWHILYQNILTKYPYFNNLKSLNEVNTMTKNFKVNLNTKINRTIIEHNNNIIENTLDQLYSIDIDDIKNKKKNVFKYYHIERDISYIPLNFKVMFENIKEYDYLEPINKLYQYFGNDSYYKKIKSVWNIPLTKEPLNSYDIIDTIDRDLIMNEYIKCRPNSFILTLWPITGSIDVVNKFVDFLNKKGNIYYVKTVSMSKNAIINLMFWMYNDFTFSKRLDFINKRLLYSKILEKNNQVTFIIFDNVKNLDLSNQSSKEKTIFKNKLLELLEIKENNNNITGDDVLYINDYFYQTVEYCNVILNENSLNLLEYQDINKYSSAFFSDSHLRLQTYRKWQYLSLTPLERSQFIIIGGNLLFIFGIRKSNDINALMISIDKTENQPDINDEIDTLFGKNNPYRFINIDKNILSDKNNQIANFFGCKNFKEIITNPKYYLYHQGIKYCLLDMEIVRKIYRNKIKEDMTDFIMINLIKPELIGKYVYFDKNRKIQYNKKDLKIDYDPPIIDYKGLYSIRKQLEKKYLKIDIKLFEEFQENNYSIISNLQNTPK